MLNKCSACTMPRCVSVCMYVVCIMSASIHTCRCALSYEWTVFYSTYCSHVCLRCIWIWMTSHCTVSDCQSSWCETTRPQRSLLNSVLTHTHSHSQTLIYINKLNVHYKLIALELYSEFDSHQPAFCYMLSLCADVATHCAFVWALVLALALTLHCKTWVNRFCAGI